MSGTIYRNLSKNEKQKQVDYRKRYSEKLKLMFSVLSKKKISFKKVQFFGQEEERFLGARQIK